MNNYISKSYNNKMNLQKKNSLLNSYSTKGIFIQKKKDKSQLLFNHKSSLEVLINVIKSFQNEYFAKDKNITNVKQMLTSLKDNLSFMNLEKIKKLDYLKTQIDINKKMLQSNLFCDSTSSLTTKINNIKLEKNHNYPFIVKKKELKLINFELENEIQKTDYLIEQKHQINVYLKSIPFFLDTNEEIFCTNNYEDLETITEILHNIKRKVRENFVNIVKEKMNTEFEINTITLQLNTLRDNIIFDNSSKNKKYINTEEIIYEETKENNKTFVSNQSKRNSLANPCLFGVKNIGNIALKRQNKKHLSIDGTMKDNIKRNSFIYMCQNNELLNDSKNQINNYLNMNINVNINVNNHNYNKNHYSTSSIEEDNKSQNSSEEKSKYEIELDNNNKIVFTPIPTAENIKDN